MGKFKFDVAIGNPPYQEDTNGAGRQAKPIYNLFIEQVKSTNPEAMTFIIPSRWFAGGMGLDKFRNDIMNDKHISKLVDYTNAKDCFPDNSIGGGVCFFTWNKNYDGDCKFSNVINGETTTMTRPLNEFPVLVRYNEAIDIIRKVRSFDEPLLADQMSSLMPFGLNTSYRGKETRTSPEQLALYASGNSITYIDRNEITKGLEYVDKYKVMISKTSAEHAGEPGSDGRFRVIPSSLRVMLPGEVCTHSYFMVGPFDDKATANNVMTYLQTAFVRFLILMSLSGIGLSKLVFNFVPTQDFSKPWTDEELYRKYGITDEQVQFIQSMIKPMANGEA